MDHATHIPVLLNKVIEYLRCEKGKVFLDCTLGAGGHTGAIADIVCPEGKVFAIDRDKYAIELAADKLSRFGKCIVFLHGNFAMLNDLLDSVLAPDFDGILFDLGFSSMQVDDAQRGFSFMHDGALDMRMDSDSALNASDIVNKSAEEELAKILYEYGEERWSKRIAGAIVKYRMRKKIMTTLELAKIVIDAIPFKSRHGRIHPATRTFQALRIAVNQELENIEKALPVAFSRLKKRGRLAVISYHSLEDKIVKRFFSDFSRGCICPKDIPFCVCGRKPLLRIINRKVITPDENEIKKNPRARSAKMRVCEKL